MEKNVKKFLNENKKSIIFFIAILVIVFVSYFLDKDLSKVLGVAGFFVWFLREYSKQLLAKDLEKFKAELQNESIKFKITYEKLHVERAEVIKNVYKKIVKTYNTSRACIISEDTSESKEEREKNMREKHKIADSSFNELRNYYEENRIFFEEEVTGNLNELVKKFKKAAAYYASSRISGRMGDTKISYGQWKTAFDEIEENIPSAKKIIENKFREIIGINDKTNDSN